MDSVPSPPPLTPHVISPPMSPPRPVSSSVCLSTFYPSFPFFLSTACSVVALWKVPCTAAAIKAPFTALGFTVCVCFSIHPVKSKINAVKVAGGTPGFLLLSVAVLHHVSHKDSQRHPGFESTTPCADVLIFLCLPRCVIAEFVLPSSPADIQERTLISQVISMNSRYYSSLFFSDSWLFWGLLCIWLHGLRTWLWTLFPEIFNALNWFHCFLSWDIKGWVATDKDCEPLHQLLLRNYSHTRTKYVHLKIIKD